MIKKTVASLLAIVVISAISGTGAQAAGITSSATAGGLCVTAGTVTPIGGKSYTCTKVLTGKLVWVLTTTVGTPKPQISGGARGDGGFGDNNKGGSNAARQASLKKYNACLLAHGGTAILAPAVVRQPDDGRKPTTKPSTSPTATPTPTPTVTPTLSVAQKAAMTACASLAPKPRLKGDN